MKELLRIYMKKYEGKYEGNIKKYEGIIKDIWRNKG